MLSPLNPGRFLPITCWSEENIKEPFAAACRSNGSFVSSKCMSIQPSRILTQCPLCQSAYAENGIRLVGEQGVTRLFHCSCEQCGRAMLAVVLEASGVVSSVGVVTDLEAADAKRFHDAPAISVDECLRFHVQLEEESRALCHALLNPSKTV